MEERIATTSVVVTTLLGVICSLLIYGIGELVSLQKASNEQLVLLNQKVKILTLKGN